MKRYKPGMRVIVQGGNVDARGMDPNPDPPWPEGTLLKYEGRGWWTVAMDDGRQFEKHGHHLFLPEGREAVQRWQDVLNARRAASDAWFKARDKMLADWEEANPHPYKTEESRVLRDAADGAFAQTPYPMARLSRAERGY